MVQRRLFRNSPTPQGLSAKGGGWFQTNGVQWYIVGSFAQPACRFWCGTPIASYIVIFGNSTWRPAHGAAARHVCSKGERAIGTTKMMLAYRYCYMRLPAALTPSETPRCK